MDEKSLQQLLAEIAIIAAGSGRRDAVESIVAYLKASAASETSTAMVLAIQGLVERRYNDVLLLLRPLCNKGLTELAPFAALAARHQGLGQEAESFAKQAKDSDDPALVAFAESFLKER